MASQSNQPNINAARIEGNLSLSGSIHSNTSLSAATFYSGSTLLGTIISNMVAAGGGGSPAGVFVNTFTGSISMTAGDTDYIFNGGAPGTLILAPLATNRKIFVTNI